MTDHRKILAPFPDAPRGTCRMCGVAIQGINGRPSLRAWHGDCLTKFRMQYASFAREKLFQRDGGKCTNCGGSECGADGVARLHVVRAAAAPLHTALTEELRLYCPVTFETRVPTWHHDHIIPLKDDGAFDLSNLQTLGPKCHEAKTSQEASARAKVRRIRQRQAGQLAPLKSLDGQRLV